MPTSEKRVVANRANALKSTGPRTVEGKERSKMNAVTHGLTAQAAVLPGEDREELEALSGGLMRELKPSGVIQRLVAERIVSLTWKLRRVARAEEVVSRQMDEYAARSWEHEAAIHEATGGRVFAGLGAKPRKRSGAAILADSIGSAERRSGDGRLVHLTQYELKLDAALRAAVRELRALQKEQGGAAPAEGEGPEAEVPAVKESPEENEPNGDEREVSEMNSETPGLRSPVSESESPASDDSAPDKTNPAPADDAAAQPAGATGLRAESSAPAPGTSSSLPPATRR